MNEAASVSVSSGLARYHSAPSSFLASLNGLCDDVGFHFSADAGLPAQELMASLFSDDFVPDQHQHQHQQQQQSNGLASLEATPLMLQPYPGAAHNRFLLQDLSGSVAESVEASPTRDAMDFDPGRRDFASATGGWSAQPTAAAAAASWLPVTPPKLRLLRHTSLPATLLSNPSDDCQNRQKFRHRMGAGLTGSYDLQEPYLREESSDETEEDGRFAKRGRGNCLNQTGSVEVLLAENASIPKQLPGGLLPCNTTPCLARAKRGHATHPRSISERLRRSRISEGIKKLQELVPNIEKQMNTADMLDEAVEYIKCLQRQVQELSNNRVVSSDVKPLLCSSVISAMP